MNTRIRNSIADLLLSLSKVQSVISPVVGRHQLQVAYLSYRLAEQLKLPRDRRSDLYLAALVHDIGALSIREKLDIIEKEPIHIHTHAFRGAYLIREFEPLKAAADILKYHHVLWDRGKGAVYNGQKVPLESQILHLADRTCILLSSRANVLSQLHGIFEGISEKAGDAFVPEQVEALKALVAREYIWLDLTSENPVSTLPTALLPTIEMSFDDMATLTRIVSFLVDFRSPFTANHSVGVAKVAEKLAELMNFSPLEIKQMLIAGYLHDLGKLAIDNSILEKPTSLSADEFNEMRSHTYYTYHLLDNIGGMENIKPWAAFHHERLDGKGYPFHMKGANLSLGSRIMCVSDVFTAITEDRPYRKGLGEEQAINVLKNMAQGNALDPRIVNALTANFSKIQAIRQRAQAESQIHYQRFFDIAE